METRLRNNFAGQKERKKNIFSKLLLIDKMFYGIVQVMQYIVYYFNFCLKQRTSTAL